MPKINIPQKKMTIHVENNANLMNSLIEAQLPVASSCHGDGICSMCKVKIVGSVTEPQTAELETLKRNKCEADERLCCQIYVNSDITVTTKYW